MNMRYNEMHLLSWWWVFHFSFCLRSVTFTGHENFVSQNQKGEVKSVASPLAFRSWIWTFFWNEQRVDYPLKIACFVAPKGRDRRSTHSIHVSVMVIVWWDYASDILVHCACGQMLEEVVTWSLSCGKRKQTQVGCTLRWIWFHREWRRRTLGCNESP